MLYKNAFILIVSIFMVIISVGSAAAFTVSPGVVEMTIPEGASKHGSFTVVNTEEKTIYVKVGIEDWSSEQYGRAVDRNEQPSLAWFELNGEILKLEPYQSRTIDYTIRIPNGARGEYSAMVYFGSPQERSEDGVSIVSRIGNAFYVIVEGTEVVKGKISNIKIFSGSPLKIDVVINNMGNIHIRPKGIVSIIKEETEAQPGQDAMKIPFNDAGFPVLPQQSYVFEVRSKKALDKGRYRLELDVEFGEERLQKEVLRFEVDEQGGVIQHAQ